MIEWSSWFLPLRLERCPRKNGNQDVVQVEYFLRAKLRWWDGFNLGAKVTVFNDINKEKQFSLSESGVTEGWYQEKDDEVLFRFVTKDRGYTRVNITPPGGNRYRRLLEQQQGEGRFKIQLEYRLPFCNITIRRQRYELTSKGEGVEWDDFRMSTL